MKTQRNILIAFILNLSFAAFEFFGGIFTGSVAILSDAVHDLGDAASIGLAYFLEKKSKQHPDERYTYGYGRFSVLGSMITTLILLVGSATMIYHAIGRIITPTHIDYGGMIVFAIIGVIVVKKKIGILNVLFCGMMGLLFPLGINFQMIMPLVRENARAYIHHKRLREQRMWMIE